jgi:hypothetical protein
MRTHDEIIAEAQRRHPHNHIVDDPFGETGEAESDPYGYEETARLAFIAGGAYALEGETPTTDDREAVAKILTGLDDREWGIATSEGVEHLSGYFDAADRILAWMSTRRPSPPTEEQWEYAVGYQGSSGQWFPLGDWYRFREVAEHDLGQYSHDPIVVLLRRKKAGAPEPVEAAARVGEWSVSENPRDTPRPRKDGEAWCTSSRGFSRCWGAEGHPEPLHASADRRWRDTAGGEQG